MIDLPEEQVQRKLLGAFYTASETANAISQLAITRRDELVLDPCFGGCAFLEAVRSRFETLGSRSPMRGVYGVDVDPRATRYLNDVAGVKHNQFLVRDFLDVPSSEFKVRFDVVLGNPPFVRHHLLADDAMVRARARLVKEQDVPKTADYWLYFFHHSLEFLKPGGCLAMVLPGSFLNASYADSARVAVAERFAYGDMFLVRQRLFADALESPVILIARGFQAAPIRSRLNVVDSASEIPKVYASNQGADVDLTERHGPWRLALLTKESRTALSLATHHSNVSQLGTVATIRIGVVTGANRFFTLSASDATAHRLRRPLLRNILTTSKQFPGLEVTSQTLMALKNSNERVLLLNTKGHKPDANLVRYLKLPVADVARRAFKCRDRAVWHEVDDVKHPDAFLSYVVDRVPRLVLNPAQALCTNAIHRLWWRGTPSHTMRQGLALSITSSLGGMSAELYGRSAGGGALKLEPSEAAALWVPTIFRDRSNILKAFRAASKALQADDWKQARQIADQAVLRGELGMSAVQVANLRHGHDALLALRFSLAARAKRRAV